MVTVSIIGVGRVGGALALSLPPDRYLIENLIYRSKPPVELISAEMLALRPVMSTIDELTGISSEIVFITTPDAEISAAAQAIEEKLINKPAVFHTSGSLASTVLDNLKNAGSPTGSIHPLVSISKSSLGPKRFHGAYFCVEGDPKARQIGTAVVADLGGLPFSIDTTFKTLYHAAAVTACGHLVALFDAAIEMMTKCGLSPSESKSILMPLVLSTVQNLSEQSTSSALTGTFARADIETFTRHLTSLNANVSDDLLEIYLLLGERSLELAAKEGVSPERIDKLKTKVAIAKSKLKW